MTARILVAGWGSGSLERWTRLAAQPGGNFDVRSVEREPDIARALATWDPDVVVVAEELLHHVISPSAAAGRTRPAVLLVGEANAEAPPRSPGIFQRFDPALGLDDLTRLVVAAACHARSLPLGVEPPSLSVADTPQGARRLHRVLRAARRVASKHDLPGMAEEVTAGAMALTGSQRGYCWFYDATTAELWRHRGPQPDLEFDASAGVVGFVARTGRDVVVLETGADVRFERSRDDPASRGDEQLIAYPILGADGGVHAVVVVVRENRGETFGPDEYAALGMFAGAVGTAVHQLALQLETQAALDRPRDGGLFRPEAVQDHAQAGSRGGVVRVSPAWVGYAYVAVVVFSLAAVVAMVVGRVDQYSTGPALVRVSGRTEVTADLPGTLEAIEVEVGDRVEAGAVLARLYGANDPGRTERLEREFASALRARMSNPDDPAADQAVQVARRRRDEAREAREQRVVRAPHAGVVSDVRVRTGQAAAPGDVLVSLVTDRDRFSVVAVLPGSARPMLAPGLPLRLEIRGYAYAYADLTIDTVADEVVGPAEIRRALGSVADVLPATESAVIVRARLSSPSFESEGRTYAYHDGMPAVADVRLRSQSVLELVVPGLRGMRWFR